MQSILQHLFGKNTLQDIPVESLREYASRYPYFAVAQYLLTKKLQEIDHADSEQQFQKTLIYFHNPFWLKNQLLEKHSGANASTVAQDASVSSEIGKDPVSHDLLEEVVLNQESVQGTPEELIDEQTRAFDTQIGNEASEASIEAGSRNNAGLHSQITPESSPEPIEERTQEVQVINHPSRQEEQTIQQEAGVSFQAYHTIDYFASQGIKLTQEASSNDKLGKQLKSFTEWLKTMRRLPEATIEQTLERNNDPVVEKIAAHSLEETEVLTEAMAEVLVKQGRHEKALEVYNKLSLLHPHKSAYFAAKIEVLKPH